MIDLLGCLNCLSLGLIISSSFNFSFISLMDYLPEVVVAVDNVLFTLLILKSLRRGFLDA